MESFDGRDVDLVPAGREHEVIAGECETSRRVLAEVDGVRTGVWACTPGEWRSEWRRWEVFTVLSGLGELVDDDGTVHRLHPGVMISIAAGSSGTWRVVETLRKSFIVPGG